MKHPIWSGVIHGSADPERVRHFLQLFAAANISLQDVSAKHARILGAVFSGSPALSTVLLSHPDWLSLLEPRQLEFPRRKEGLMNEVTAWLRPLLEAARYQEALGRVREFKQREMLRIGARDLSRPGHVEEILQEISDVADVCLESVWKICRMQLVERHGEPWHQDADGNWRRTLCCLIGLGKLGGQELNYSSDVDVIVVYEEEGTVIKGSPPKGKAKSGKGEVASARPGGTALSNHQFFNRLTEAFVTELTRLGPEGMLYRIDLRLRPEGDAGPLSRSLPGHENYYAQWGQTWERMMLIKARRVAGDAALAAEFFELIQPFRYPRSLNPNVLPEIAGMKQRIEAEVVRAGELERNVKLGRGGIREIEFVTQILQLLHAGRQPFLQGAQTLPTLQKLAQYELLAPRQAKALTDAYGFLRDVEHRLQMEENRQTHTIRGDPEARGRLARLMGFKNSKAFDAAFQEHTQNVRAQFQRVLEADIDSEKSETIFPRDFKEGEAEWRRMLGAHRFKDVDKAFRVVREFVEGPGYVHVSSRTKEVAYQLLRRLFALCDRGSQFSGRNKKATASGERLAPGASNVVLSDPDRVMTRLDSFIVAYGARGTLFELWNSNPDILVLLALLFDRSEFLAELAIRTPDLVDELVTSGRLRQRKSPAETLRDLRHGLGDADQFGWLRRYHQTELMRIGLRDILGLADFEQYLTELSALADACLQYALEVVMKKNRLKQPPFVIVGLGKLGGREIDYGSDLDIIFVANAKAKDLPRLAKRAVEVMELLSKRTEEGIVFHTDARLRPDGEKGLLVNSIVAYEQYYRHRAQLWEIQALTRVRAIAGDVEAGQQFWELAGRLADFSKVSAPLSAYVPDWKARIHHMRMRIEKERTPPGKDDLAIKTGKGGLMDAEFIGQILCLQFGWKEPNTLQSLQLAAKAKALAQPEALISNYRKLRRVEGILRRWSYEGETVLPDDPAPYYRVSVRCGFDPPEEFRQAVASWRSEIREAYLKIIGNTQS